MDKSFIHEFNEFEVRNTKKCRCRKRYCGITL